MTSKDEMERLVSEMSEEGAAGALAHVAGARAGATPTDVYGTVWGEVLADVEPRALTVTGSSAIAIPMASRRRVRVASQASC